MQEAVKQRIEGNWDQIRGRIKKAWGNITDDDLKRAEGDLTQLVGVIKERTGESRQDIERRLEEMGRS